jgi:hypothetical protein
VVKPGQRAATPSAWIALAAAGLLQITVHLAGPPPRADPHDLGRAPDLARARLIALGDATVLARTLMLGLQAYDVQPGVSLPLRSLDYPRVIGWLELILALHPVSQYALLSAAQLYAEVPDPGRCRLMLEFIHRAFLADPDHRWPWMAHAVVLARHRLHEPELALVYARELREHVRDPGVPHWVSQMEVLALADLGRTEAARVLLGGLLASGTITEPHERHFLLERLRQLEFDETGRASGTSELRQ